MQLFKAGNGSEKWKTAAQTGQSQTAPGDQSIIMQTEPTAILYCIDISIYSIWQGLY